MTKYQKRISGPLLDRIDIHVEVPEVDYEKLSDDRMGEPSSEIRKRVQAARDRQRVRFEGTDIVCNSDMRVVEVRQFCKLDEAGDSLARQAMSQLNLSARGYHRVLKLARTIADLVGIVFPCFSLNVEFAPDQVFSCLASHAYLALAANCGFLFDDGAPCPSRRCGPPP